jgi:hypothetical protein
MQSAPVSYSSLASVNELSIVLLGMTNRVIIVFTNIHSTHEGIPVYLGTHLDQNYNDL